MGGDCSQPCPIGTFGPNCAHECYCHNGATCNRVDGKCKCKAGYAGNRCEDHCPEGYFGDDCYQACQCESDNYLCHPTRGCVCQPRYGGKNCSTPISSMAVYPESASEDDGHSGYVFGGIFTFIIILVVASLVIFFYRRRFKKLKTEHALYIASSETDQQSFQNPMYATFRNPSPTNSTQRLTSSQVQGRIVKQMHTTPTILLTKVQDPGPLCNKNVYSAIDELKESALDENIYEELKKNKTDEGGAIPDESYDRLDFTRPSQDLLPHYLSTETIKSQRSRNSSSPSKDDRSAISDKSFESQASDTDFCQSVLTSVENLNASSTRTRKTIYEPETDSGISSNRSTTTTTTTTALTEIM